MKKKFKRLFMLLTVLIGVYYLIVYGYFYLVKTSSRSTKLSDRFYARRAAVKGDKKNTPVLARNLKLPQKYVLFSKCYCQKELVSVLINERDYEITIHNDTHFIRAYSVDRDDMDAFKFTCNIYDVLRRGPNQKVVSFTLENEQQIHLVENLIKMVSVKYPSWIIRFYYRGSAIRLSRVLCEKQCIRFDRVKYDNVDFCDVEKIPMNLLDSFDAGYLLPLSWRWLPMGDDFVNIFLSRDMKGCIIEREVTAVYKWFKLNTSSLHIMRDHPSHSTPLEGGLWGFYTIKNRPLANKLFNSLVDNFIPRWYNFFRHNEADFYLRKLIYPLVNSNETLIHDSYRCNEFKSASIKNVLPFPTRRDTLCYVGSSLCCINPSAAARTDKLPVCPSECRLSTEWTYC